MNLLDILGAAVLIAAIIVAIHSARRAYERNKERKEQARARYKQMRNRLYTEQAAEIRAHWRTSAPATPQREYLDESIVFMPMPAPITNDEPCRRERYSSDGDSDFGGGGATSSWDSSSSSSSDSSSSSSDSSSCSSSD